MKIAIIIKGLDDLLGGGFTFKTSIIDALGKEESTNDFLIFDLAEAAHVSELPIPYVNIPQQFPEENKRVSASGESLLSRIVRRTTRRVVVEKHHTPQPLVRAIDHHGVDLVWFLDQLAYDIQVPFIFTVWDLQHRIQPWFPEVSSLEGTWGQREDMYRTMLRRASLVLTGTEAGKQEVQMMYGVHPDNIMVQPLPLPTAIREAEISSPGETLKKHDLASGFLLYPAQFWAHKNHVSLLNALSMLRETRGYSPKLVLVGSERGNRDHIQTTIRRLNLESQTSVLGFVPLKDLIDLYQSAESLVFVSFFGPDNLPPLEAFHLGCPVIASAVSGAKEQLGDAAILIDPLSPQDIADAIWHIHSDQGLRERLVERGRAIVKEKSADNYVKQVSGEIDRLERIMTNWK